MTQSNGKKQKGAITSDSAVYGTKVAATATMRKFNPP